MRKTCSNVSTALTLAVFLSANMFSFPILDDLEIFDGIKPTGLSSRI